MTHWPLTSCDTLARLTHPQLMLKKSPLCPRDRVDWAIDPAPNKTRMKVPESLPCQSQSSRNLSTYRLSPPKTLGHKDSESGSCSLISFSPWCLSDNFSVSFWYFVAVLAGAVWPGWPQLGPASRGRLGWAEAVTTHNAKADSGHWTARAQPRGAYRQTRRSYQSKNKVSSDF